MNEEAISVNGIRTHYVHAGTGKPLVLVHGLGGPRMWQRIVEPLSAQFHVYAVDLPGFGESECPGLAFSSAQYAGHVLSMLDKLSLPSASLAGISYGGEISATLAAQYPNRVAGLVLVASSGLYSTRSIALNDVRWTMFATFVHHIVLRSRTMLDSLSRRSFHDIGRRPADLVEAFHRELSEPCKRDVWLSCLRNVLAPSPDFRRLISTIRQRTLILWGSEDRVIHPEAAGEFHRMIPGSELEVFAGCGHSMPLEMPEKVCEAIFRFLY